MVLGREIVSLYHGKAAAKAAAEKWEKMFSRREVSSADLPVLKIKPMGGKKFVSPPEIALKSGVAKSNSQAWRLVREGAVSVSGVVKKDPTEAIFIKGGEIVKVGKKKFFRVV